MSKHLYSRTFKAYDVDGNEYTIDEYIEHSPKRSLGGLLAELLDDTASGVKELRTSNGRKVAPLKGNQLQIPSGNGPIIVTTSDAEFLRNNME